MGIFKLTTKEIYKLIFLYSSNADYVLINNTFIIILTLIGIVTSMIIIYNHNQQSLITVTVNVKIMVRGEIRRKISRGVSTYEKETSVLNLIVHIFTNNMI